MSGSTFRFLKSFRVRLASFLFLFFIFSVSKCIFICALALCEVLILLDRKIYFMEE